MAAYLCMSSQLSHFATVVGQCEGCRMSGQPAPTKYPTQGCDTLMHEAWPNKIRLTRCCQAVTTISHYLFLVRSMIVCIADEFRQEVHSGAPAPRATARNNTGKSSRKHSFSNTFAA